MARIEGKCKCKTKVSENCEQCNKLEKALCLELRTIVEALSAPEKGLLAADQSSSSLKESFDNLNIRNSENAHRDYREMLFTADKNLLLAYHRYLNKCRHCIEGKNVGKRILSKYISGILLNPETLYQKTSNNLEFVDLVRQLCIIPGVKVDKGLVPLCGTENEKTTQGLDYLKERCIQYKRDGCHFTKWRCVFNISDKLPSRTAIVANANDFARYATICQSEGLVPIIEPEILNDGDFSLEKALEVHEEVLSTLFQILMENHVYLEGIILKPAMVLPGTKSNLKCTPETIAEFTITALQRTVPPAVQTIMFLSGGQPDYTAFLNLNAINLYEGKKPWRLTFCFGRVLQNQAMKIWSGNIRNVLKAQTIFLEKVKLSSEASQGKMEEDLLENEDEE